MTSYTLSDGQMHFAEEKHPIPYAALDNETLYEIMTEHGYEGFDRDDDMMQIVLLFASPPERPPSPPPERELRALYSCQGAHCPMVVRKNDAVHMIAAISHDGFHTSTTKEIFTHGYPSRGKKGFMDFLKARQRKRRSPAFTLPRTNKSETLLTWYRSQRGEVTVVLLCSGGLRLELDLLDAVLRDAEPTPIHFVLVDTAYGEESTSWLPGVFMREAASRAGDKALRCTVLTSVKEYLERIQTTLDVGATAIVALDTDSIACKRASYKCAGAYKVVMDVRYLATLPGYVLEVYVVTDRGMNRVTVDQDAIGERFAYIDEYTV
jgi:hypothetical protein